MLLNPLGEFSSPGCAGGDAHDHAFCVINFRFQLETIEHKENFHGGVADALVSVHERVISNQREAECGGLFRQGWIQVRVRERGARLCHGRLECAKVSQCR